LEASRFLKKVLFFIRNMERKNGKGMLRRLQVQHAEDAWNFNEAPPLSEAAKQRQYSSVFTFSADPSSRGCFGEQFD
jgi:hypothetical protein